MWEITNEYDHFDWTQMESIIRAVGTNSPPFRSSGGRAHRKWRKRRAAGRSK